MDEEKIKYIAHLDHYYCDNCHVKTNQTFGDTGCNYVSLSDIKVLCTNCSIGKEIIIIDKIINRMSKEPCS